LSAKPADAGTQNFRPGARISGIDRACYGGIEREQWNVAALNLAKIVAALCVEIGKLFPPLSAFRRVKGGQ
jgi:hypothetical protein